MNMPHITISKCSVNDTLFVYECRYDPTSNKNSINQNTPTLQEHTEWFGKKLLESDVMYLKAIVGNVAIGFVRFVNTNEGIEVSICIHPEFRGCDYSKQMVYQAILIRGESEKMYSTIKLHNTISYQVFAWVSARLAI